MYTQRNRPWPGGRCWAPEGRVDRGEDGTTGRMWRCIRIKKAFNVADIASIANVSAGAARSYLAGLAGVGVIRLVQKYTTGTPGSMNEYRLAKDLGRYAPRIQRNGDVFDPNAKKTIAKIAKGGAA